jgi:hypothetical protein
MTGGRKLLDKLPVNLRLANGRKNITGQNAGTLAVS